MKKAAHVFFVIIGLLLFYSAVYSLVKGFSVYTFKCDPTLKIGYPTNWIVQEEMDKSGSVLSAVITRSAAADSEGYLVYFVPFPENTQIKNARQFAAVTISNLRKNVLPGLKVDKEYPHKSMPLVHVSDVSLDDGNTKFLGRSYSVFQADGSRIIGLFSLFYAPQSTFGNFNAGQMLAGLLTPIFGTQTAQTPVTPARGDLDSRFIGTWAMHTTVAGDTMMQENTYKPDGTFVIRQFASGSMMSTTLGGSGSASQTLHGTWRVHKGLFYLRWKNGGEAVYRFTFTGTTFHVMQGVNVKETLKFRRVSR